MKVIYEQERYAQCLSFDERFPRQVKVKVLVPSGPDPGMTPSLIELFRATGSTWLVRDGFQQEHALIREAISIYDNEVALLPEPDVRLLMTCSCTGYEHEPSCLYSKEKA
jgi:hypothetical protein